MGVVATVNPAGNPFFLLREMPGDAYPRVLQRLLAERYSTQAVTVINGGKGGERAADAVGRAQGAVLIDLYQAMAGQTSLDNSDDGRHPSVAGYRKIAEVVFAAIGAELEVR